MGADVRIKRIYEPPAKDDGARILIDRIWPRGISKKAAALTLWFKDAAPSTGLRKWFGHDPARWTEFQKRYRAELQNNRQALDDLSELAGTGRVTLLYATHDTEHNHALILADYLRRHSGSHHGRVPA